MRRAPAHPVAEPLGDVRAAAGFLTRLPVGAVNRDAVGAGAFGVVGAGIGLLAAVPLVLLGRPVPLVAAVLAVAVIVLVTGAVHIDGLADTADALAAPSPDAAERARNDPGLGSGGVATMTLALALGIACLATLAAQDPVLAATALVVAATVSRSAAPVAALGWSKTGRATMSASGGAGAWFVRLVGPPEIAAVLATSLVAVAAGTALAGPAIALGSVGGVAAGAAIAAWVLLRRGQLDGDGYGAVIELVFVDDAVRDRRCRVAAVSAHLVVVLGGTRSGKSRHGRDRAAALAGDGRVAYLGTVVAGDDELDDRVRRHRADRPAAWGTIEVGRDLPGAIRSVAPGTTILLDGLTLWLSLVFGDEPRPIDDVLDGVFADVLAAIDAHDGPVVVVSDEIGLGLVPLDALSRAFRDLLGIAHQRLVERSDEAWFMVAGRPLALLAPEGS